ncbi:MAG: orotidine-5'-phosphate decarboxylase [Fibrobacterota bacterium]|nr:orotidine-5'-phosphate decarboxylase [Fibrobacterota bacterium]
MSYQDRVRARTREAGNTVCVGMDPVLKKIPGQAPPEEKIKRFYSDMLDAMLTRNVLPAAVKPNMAYYEAVSLPCLLVLKDLIAAFKQAGVLVVLDAKRGDISSTSGAYAQMAFQVFGADAVTLAPYMGLDTVKPFQDVAKDHGIYVLVRTSNPSAKDFQDLPVGNEGVPLYRKVAEKLADWNDGSLGAVVGATAPRELQDLLAYWKGRGRDVPVLIPGIAITGVSGGQTGSVADVYQAIKDAGSDPWLHLINSSSGINYAYEKYPDLKPAQASVAALEELVSEIAGKL